MIYCVSVRSAVPATAWLLVSNSPLSDACTAGGDTDGLGRRPVDSHGLRYITLFHAVMYDQCRLRQRLRLHREREDLLHLYDDTRL